VVCGFISSIKSKNYNQIALLKVLDINSDVIGNTYFTSRKIVEVKGGKSIAAELQFVSDLKKWQPCS
jgi:hypothetical protein